MSPGLTMFLTRDAADIRAAQRLRYDVFVDEMGATPGGTAGLDADAFDAVSDHILLTDPAHPDRGVIATLRVGWTTDYTAREFDLGALKHSGRSLAEAGRACLHPAYRGGLAGVMLFRGLIDLLNARGVALAVGTASFPGADAARHLPALRRLHQEALAPPDLRPVARGPQALRVEGTAPRSAMAGVPALIKSYLRAGAWVGDGAFVDRDFNTVDVCMVMDMTRLKLPARAR